MSLLEVERPKKKVVPDPIVATKVAREVQEAFDRLAETTYKCTRAELFTGLCPWLLKTSFRGAREMESSEEINIQFEKIFKPLFTELAVLIALKKIGERKGLENVNSMKSLVLTT